MVGQKYFTIYSAASRVYFHVTNHSDDSYHQCLSCVRALRDFELSFNSTLNYINNNNQLTRYLILHQRFQCAYLYQNHLLINYTHLSTEKNRQINISNILYIQEK